MQYEILYPGSNAMISIKLDPGEHVQAEAGAMLSRTEAIDVEGTLAGGFGRSMKRAVLGGETLFFQTLRAARGYGEVNIAPSMLGDIKILPLANGQDYFIKNGSLLASFENVTLDTKMQKLSTGFFSGAGLFIIHAHGQGHIAISAFGAVIEKAVAPGEKFVVDNGHLVAWTGDIDYRIIKGGKTWMSSFTSGEGLACEFTGPGKIWMQSRNPEAFGGWIRGYVATRGGSVLSLLS